MFLSALMEEGGRLLQCSHLKCAPFRKNCTFNDNFVRYDNTGCGRSYLSQRDLDAHILYRHNKDKGVLKQTVVAPHLNPPPSQASLAAFSLPPFFQSGILPVNA